MNSRFLTFILILFCFIYISDTIAQSCATVYLNDDNLPSLPDALCVDDELALCFDLNVDETTFDASLIEFNYNLLLGGVPSSVQLESIYKSGTAIDENASGQICFTATIPAGSSACDVFDLSLEIMTVFYNDPSCDNNLIAYDLNLTSPLPLMMAGDNLNTLVPLLGIASLNPITVSIFPNPNWSAVVTQAPTCDGNTTATVEVTASNGELCETIENLGTSGLNSCPKVDAVFPEYTYTKFTTYIDGDGNEQNNPCAISITLPEQIVECSGLLGCTNENACNYNPDACEDDNSCSFNDCNGECGGSAVAGSACDDGDAGTQNDVYGEDCNCAGSTVAATEGCTDAAACNYDADATEDNGSCLFNDCNGDCGGSAITGTACDDGNTVTENDVYGEDCSCKGTPVGGVLGCTDPLYCNYNPDATVEDGSCIGNDCNGECGGTAFPGQRCDDNSVLTINDIYNSSCECVGEQIENLCELEVFDVSYVCEENNKVTVVLNIEGEGTYNGTDGLDSFTDLQSGSYTYTDYPTHSGFEFLLNQTEGNNEGCIVVKKLYTPRCLPCNSNAGLIGVNDYTQPEVNVCEGDRLQLRNTGTVLGAYQSLFFIIHSAGPNIGLADLPLNEEDIFALGRDIENTEELTGNYWATAVVAATSSQNGNADYEDPCLVVSNTIKINLLEPIEINHTPTCDEDTGYSFTLDLEGGLPQLDDNTSYNVVSNYFNGTIAAGETFTSDYLPNGAMYSFLITDDNACDIKSELFVVSCANPLPIELISFNGEALSSGNLLKWVTATEINNDFFTIESSTNGIDYQTVTTIEGSGTNTKTSSYQYMHRAASGGTTYYKLIQTDFDGTTVEVANIELTRAESTEFGIISILPVPAINYLEITLQNAGEETVFEIFDVIGRSILKETYEAERGSDLYKLNVKNLVSGIYFVSVTNNTKVVTKRFIKD